MSLLITCLEYSLEHPEETSGDVDFISPFFFFLICLLLKCPMLSQCQLCCGKSLCITILYLPSLSLSNISFHCRHRCSCLFRSKSSVIPFPWSPPACTPAPSPLTNSHVHIPPHKHCSFLPDCLFCHSSQGGPAYVLVCLPVCSLYGFVSLCWLSACCWTLLWTYAIINVIHAPFGKKNISAAQYVSTLAQLLDGWTID